MCTHMRVDVSVCVCVWECGGRERDFKDLTRAIMQASLPRICRRGRWAADPGESGGCSSVQSPSAGRAPPAQGVVGLCSSRAFTDQMRPTTPGENNRLYSHAANLKNVTLLQESPYRNTQSNVWCNGWTLRLAQVDTKINDHTFYFWLRVFLS